MKKDLTWDLTSLYIDDKELDKDVLKTTKKAKKYNKTYKNSLKKLSSKELKVAILEYESIIESIGKILSYTFLEFATDSKKGSKLNSYQQKCTKISEYILFFELEFNKIDKKTQLQHIKRLKEYEFYLQNLAKEKKHQLSLEAEEIMLKKDLTSSSAWSRMFDEYMAQIEFVHDGKKISEEALLSLLYNKDRKIRKSASIALTKGLEQNKFVLTYIFNMVKSDLKIDNDIRGYKNHESFRHLDNKITQKSVDSLVNTAMSNTKVVSDYYKIKAKLLGIKKLKDYDRYAPIAKSTKKIEYKDAQKMVLKAFKSFDDGFYDLAIRAFDEGWIDVMPKEGKRSGAFSHSTITKAHPYVLLNYTSSLRDVFTLAHELGHAIHQYLSRDVGYINFDTPLTTSETASIFAEMLLFESIKSELDDEDLLSIYSTKLEDIFATLFRQVVFTTFERRVHSFDGELSSDEFSKIWKQENQKMFGKSVELSKNYDIWWSYIPHFVHSPFYCYAYSYGQLLVLTLFRLYKDKRPNFKQNYIKFLSSGGSKSPSELVAMFGLDIEDEGFWELGIEVVNDIMSEFKQRVK